MGIAVEGDEGAWPDSLKVAQLPEFDILNNQQYYIDIFNKGTGSFAFQVQTRQPWLKPSRREGQVDKELRLFVSIDWSKLTDGNNEATLEIVANDKSIPVKVIASKFALPDTREPYFGGAGEFSIPAYKYHANIAGREAKWIFMPDLGRSEGCMGINPVTAASAATDNAPRLEYKIFVPRDGKIMACLGILPTQDVNPERGLRIAVSIDDAQPQILDARKGLVDIFKEYTSENLARSKGLKPLPPVNPHLALAGHNQPRRNDIFDNLRWLDCELGDNKAGMHTLKVFMIDPEIVLEQIVVNPDNQHPGYFGAPPVPHNSK
jgi:hypothetical protein